MRRLYRCTVHCTVLLFFFMIAFEHIAQQCSENDLVTAESQLVFPSKEASRNEKKIIFLLSILASGFCLASKGIQLGLLVNTLEVGIIKQLINDQF